MMEIISVHSRDFPLVNCYLSIPLPEPVKEYIRSITNAFPQEHTIRLQDIRTAHITFAFLGPVTQDEYTQLVQDITSFATACSPFAVTLDTAGYFSHANRHVLYLSMISEVLFRLHRLWVQSYPAWEKTHRTFTPHLTVARINGNFPQRLYETFQAQTVPQTFTADHVEICARYRGVHQTTLLEIPF